MDYTYITMDIMIVAALALLQYMFHRSGILDKRKRRIFTITIYVIMAAVLSQIGTTMFDNSAPQNRILSIVFNAIAFILSPYVTVLFSFVFVEKDARFKLLACIPSFINTIAVLLSPWFGFVFSVSPENRYSRGPLFFIYIVAYMVGYLLIAFSSYKLSKRYQFRARMIVHLILFFLIIGTSVQVVFPQIHTTTVCITFAIILYYAMLCEQSDRIDIQTSLLNRRTFEQELPCFKKEQKGTYILFDVDNFKGVNDTYGHMFGDYCLTTLAETIIDRLDDYGYSFRIGGDEFCACLNIADEKKVEKLLNEIKRDIKKKREKDPRIPDLSLGSVSFRQNRSQTLDIQKIMHDADAKMYENKRTKKEKIKG